MHWQLADANDPFYYWHNFDVVRRWVLTYHDKLLSVRQRTILAEYLALPKDAQCLWLRLFMRKGELFRVDRLSYGEINIPSALKTLNKRGWIESVKEPDKDSLLIFTIAELSNFYNLKRTTKTDKKSLVEELSTAVSTLPGELVRLRQNDCFNELSMLFFGNSHQQISEFVVAALGHVRYENYRIRPHAAFPDQETFHYFCQLESIRRDYRELSSHDEIIALAQGLIDNPLIKDVPDRLKNKTNQLINRIARDCERAKQIDLALQLYRYAERPPSRERQARLLYKLDPDTCYSLLLDMVERPWDEPERHVASQLLKRWFKQHNGNAEVAIPSAEAALDFKPRQVEQAALAHYVAQGWSGLHAENIIVQSLFGLIFWDIIFADVDGAFIHPFQRSPRDLNSPGFYRKRKAKIQRRLTSLAKHPNVVKSRIRHQLQTKQGLANPFIPWKWQQLDDVIVWLDRIPTPVWGTIFERLAFDVKNNRSGFPDLWLYKQGEVKLVEVKAPGDSLRLNQQQWLRHLTQNDVNVIVLNVNPLNALNAQ